MPSGADLIDIGLPRFVLSGHEIQACRAGALLPHPTRPAKQKRVASARTMSDPQAEWRELMLAALAGNTAAYRRLLATLTPPIRAFVIRRLPNDRASVEDVVQETLLAIHRYRDRYDPDQPMAPWVYAIARYKLIDHCRRVRRGGSAVPLEAIEDFLAQAEPEELAAGHDIATLIAKLPPNQSTAIRLVKLEDMSIREAAAKSGMSESAIKVNIHRGIKKLAAWVAGAASS